MNKTATELEAAEQAEAAAASRVRRLQEDARVEAEAERFAAAGASELKGLWDRRADYLAVHDQRIREAWRRFVEAVRSGDWKAVSAGYVEWTNERLEAAVTLEASTKARSLMAQKGLVRADESGGGRGWTVRYPPISFSIAIDRAFAEVATVDHDVISEHPRFVSPTPPDFPVRE